MQDNLAQTKEPSSKAKELITKGSVRDEIFFNSTRKRRRGSTSPNTLKDSKISKNKEPLKKALRPAAAESQYGEVLSLTDFTNNEIRILLLDC